MRHRLRALFSDHHGSIAVPAAITMTVLCGFTALGIDVGNMFADRRKAQSTADLAAIAAVSDLVNADKAAAATVARNGYLNNASYSIEYGVYTPSAQVAPANRFAAATAASANAARVTLNTVTPLYFARLVTGKDSFV